MVTGKTTHLSHETPSLQLSPSLYHQNGDEVRKEGDCQVCTCEDAGEMTCVDMVCPELNCEDDELVAYRDEECCPYCLSDWVEV